MSLAWLDERVLLSFCMYRINHLSKGHQAVGANQGSEPILRDRHANRRNNVFCSHAYLIVPDRNYVFTSLCDDRLPPNRSELSYRVAPLTARYKAE